MSITNQKMPLAQAELVAEHLLDKLRPSCARISVAGSIRRRKPEIGDIEIVAVSKDELDLLGLPIGKVVNHKLREMERRGALRRLKGGERYKQFEVVAEGCLLDLFLCEPEEWGVTLAIRTGPAEFSKQLVTQQERSGYLPNHLKVQHCRLWIGGVPVPTPEEEDVFRVIGLPWIEPEKRQ